jgi:hypothetical protein
MLLKEMENALHLYRLDNIKYLRLDASSLLNGFKFLDVCANLIFDKQDIAHELQHDIHLSLL